MKRFPLYLLIFFLFSSFAYAQEETTNKFDQTLADLLKTRLSIFDTIRFTLQPQSTFSISGNDYICKDSVFSDVPTATGDIKDGLTTRNIRCDTTRGVDACSISMYQYEPYRFVEKIASLTGDVVTFSRLDPAKKYLWYAWSCTKTSTSSGGGGGNVCVADVKTCPDGSTVGRDANNNCNFKACPSVPATTTDFKLFNLFRIDGLSKEQWDELDVPFLARLDSAAPSLDIYRFTIKNIGNKASAVTIETFLVAQSNPFSSIVTQGLNLIPLQATYGKSGITEQDLTCKSEAGKRFVITEMQPNEERTYYFSLAVPKQGDVLAGNSNYDINGNYITILNAISGCTGDIAFYDIIGGSRGKIPPLNVNNTPIDASAKQKTTTLEKVRTSTGTELLESTCVTTSQCKDDANCINLQSLINDGVITKTDAESRLTKYRVAIDTAGVAVGAGLATLGGVTSVGAYSSLCAAIGAGTAGLGLPICLGVLAVGGAIIGGLSADYVSDLIQGIDRKDPSAVGYCIEKESKSIFSLTGIKDSIGKALNDLFGGQAKTKASNSTIGLIALIVISILIVLRLTNRK